MHLPPGNPRNELPALQARQHVHADLIEEEQLEPPLLLLDPALFSANFFGLRTRGLIKQDSSDELKRSVCRFGNRDVGKEETRNKQLSSVVARLRLQARSSRKDAPEGPYYPSWKRTFSHCVCRVTAS